MLVIDYSNETVKKITDTQIINYYNNKQQH